MRHSESIAALAKALAEAQKAYTSVPKTKTANVKGINRKTNVPYEYEYKYADLADILNMALPCLSAQGIAFSQPHEIFPDGKLRVTTLLMHDSGEWMESDGIEVSEEGDPQQFGAESTYFRRYDGSSMIGVAPDEDTDAQNAGVRSTKRTTPAQAAQQPAGASAPAQGAQQATQRAATAPAASQPQAGQLKFIPPNGLTAVIKSIKEIEALPAKPASGTVPAMKAVRGRLVVTLLGQHNGVSEASCFDTKLWPVLKESVGLECHFQIFEGTTASNKPFIRIEDLIYVAGEELVEGKFIN